MPEQLDGIIARCWERPLNRSCRSISTTRAVRGEQLTISGRQVVWESVAAVVFRSHQAAQHQERIVIRTHSKLRLNTGHRGVEVVGSQHSEEPIENEG